MTDWLKVRYEDAKKAYAALMKFYPFSLENLDGEIWRDIEGYEGHYQISTFGRVKSLKNGSLKIMKPIISPTGYLAVDLCKGGKIKRRLIHRLVAEAFLHNSFVLPEVNHKDGQKLNNCLKNLEWVSSVENMNHAVLTGLKKSGEDNYHAALTNEQARYIRDNPDNLTLTQLAEKFGVTKTSISDIQRGKKYKAAGGEIRQKRARRPLKISQEQRDEICQLYSTGEYSKRKLGRMFCVADTTINSIINEK